MAQEVDFWLKHRTPETLLLVMTEGNVAWNSDAKDFDWQQTSALATIARSGLALSLLLGLAAFLRHRAAKLAHCRRLLAAPEPALPTPVADYRERFQ